MTSTRAAVVEAGGAPFTVSDVELDELREEGILTRGPNWQWELTKTEG